MLPQRERSRARCLYRLLGAVLVAPVVFCVLPLRAADSTSLVPADAAFYSASLRNKEQFDAVVNSKAYKRLKDLPALKTLVKKATADLEKDDKKPLEMIKKFYEDKDNKTLVEFVTEAVSTETFIYGGASWPRALSILGQVQNTMQFAGLGALLSGNDPDKAQKRALFTLLQKHKAALKMPDLVFGFKIDDAKKADAQIDRLEKLVKAHAKDAPPPFRNLVKRTRVGGSNFLTVTVDGKLIPWDEISFKDFEERPGEFDDLVKAAKEATLTVSLGVREGYLLLGITSKASDLLTIGGKGKKLIERDELAPLVKNSKKALTSIGYISKDFRGGIAGNRADLDSLGGALKGLLDKAKLPEAKKKAIEKDLEAMTKDLQRYVIDVGAALSFQYLNGNGYEGYSYDYTDHSASKGARLKLLNHFGGNPILACGAGTKGDGIEGYTTFVKWIKVIYGHGEDMLLPNVGPDEKDQYEKFTKNFFPLFRKLDETTSKLLLPSLKDGSLGLVIDAKWTSKQWHKQTPPMPKAAPALEVGLLASLSDSAKFTQALKSYRITLNELFEKSREASKDNIPPIKIPVADAEKSGANTLYFWKLPEESGLDPQFSPTIGVSKTLSAFTLSKDHAERLLKKTPLAIKSGPLVEHQKHLIAGCYFSLPTFIDAAAPWAELAVMASAGDGGADAKKEAQQVLRQVRVGLDVLKVFESYSSATYLQGNVLVTHSQTVIKDR